MIVANVVVVVSVGLVFAEGLVDCSCDRTFDSATLLKSSNKFEAPRPILARPFKISQNSNVSHTFLTNKTQNDYQQVHCMYKFIAKPGERVMLNFTTFKLRGDEPSCNKEYLEIFVQASESDVDVTTNISPLIERSPINGRFCSSIAPRSIVSLLNVVVFNFYSNLKLPSRPDSLFSGTFEFLNKSQYANIGEPLDGSLCSHVIYSSEVREGDFHSITYPGSYIKGLKCSYKFIGAPRQRIRLEFLDLDLYSGGSHCPADSIKIYDGLEESDALINTICGSHRSFVIFSSGQNLLVKFHTLDQETNIANRGFSAYFEFSDRFVGLQFISADLFVRHIRGSECDQRIISQRRTSGTIISPLTPHRASAICRYIFEGLQNSLDHERVSLKFTEFDLKSQRQLIGAIPQTSTNAATMDLNASQTTEVPAGTSAQTANSSLEQCPDNYLRLYTAELKPDQRQDPNDYDFMYCSDEVPQQTIESDAASLLMEYNAGQTGGYFKADYAFSVDFRISGTQLTQSCDFLYKSETQKNGTFNSPWHPSWYMNDVNCTYTFLPREGEALLMQFSSFKMFNETIEDSVGGYNDMCRPEDRVEIYEILNSDTVDGQLRVLEQQEIGTYCATSAPGPVLSYKPMRVVFRSNKQKVASGFSAIYNFYPISKLSTNEFVTNCGGVIHTSSRLKSGTIASPPTYKPELYEKRHHICMWEINARATFRILLSIDMFELEGTQKVRGCNKAILRLNLGNSTRKPLEFCGSKTPSGDTMIAQSYVSDGERMLVTFISTKQASGSFGFKATWSEVKRSH